MNYNKYEPSINSKLLKKFDKRIESLETTLNKVVDVLKINNHIITSNKYDFRFDRGVESYESKNPTVDLIYGELDPFAYLTDYDSACMVSDACNVLEEFLEQMEEKGLLSKKD